jgi:hypothetical protein
MDSTHDIREHLLAQAWEVLQAQHTQGEALQVDSNRLAFADPEFLLRRETRGLRMQMEMLKPDLAQIARGIEHTVVVFGSARFRSEEDSHRALVLARAARPAAGQGGGRRRGRGRDFGRSCGRCPRSRLGTCACASARSACGRGRGCKLGRFRGACCR